MKILKNLYIEQSGELLKIVLYLMSFHSLCVGIGLISVPSEMFELLGYSKCTERFFPTQGGVFHIIMAAGYLMGALKYPKAFDLIIFSIIVKFSATVFLLIYFLIVKNTWLIIISAVTDGIMGIVVFMLLKKVSRQQKNGVPN